LLILLIYVFSILFVQLSDGSETGYEKFPNIPEAMLTLLIEGTFLDEFGGITRALAQESWLLLIAWFVFTLLSALTVLNMLIGVLCEVISAVAATEREQITITTVKEALMDLLCREGIDADEDHMISKQEFVSLIAKPEAVRLLADVEVDVFGLVDIADWLFEADDVDDPNEEVKLTFAEFMEVILQLRGNNSATVKDIVDLRKYIRQCLARTESMLTKTTDTGSSCSAVSPKWPSGLSKEASLTHAMKANVSPQCSSSPSMSGSVSAVSSTTAWSSAGPVSSFFSLLGH
jgi:hypothetical protein